MAFGTQDDSDEVMNEINMTPLVDVMLVLLINELARLVQQLQADLAQQLSAAAVKQPQPELHIRGDKAVRYERVALVMASAQQAGLRKIGFITEPTR